MHSIFSRSAVTALLLAPALAAPVMAGEVKMFDRPPSVSEVQELLAAPAPAPAPRYRSIEIIGGAVKSAQSNAPSPSTTHASYETTDRRQAAPASAMAPAPVEEAAASSQPAQVATTQAQPREELHQVSDQTAFGFRINFRFDSAVIPAEAYEYLDTVGTVLHSEPGVAIVVEGHTDAKGADAYNMKLSERRAKAVEDYLVRKHQIPESRIQAVGKGKTEPLNSNPFDPNNRRVQFARAN
jgi:outer membrane protein OmpA-like peptidoglycan-associated protein